MSLLWCPVGMRAMIPLSLSKWMSGHLGILPISRAPSSALLWWRNSTSHHARKDLPCGVLSLKNLNRTHLPSVSGEHLLIFAAKFIRIHKSTYAGHVHENSESGVCGSLNHLPHALRLHKLQSLYIITIIYRNIRTSDCVQRQIGSFLVQSVCGFWWILEKHKLLS